MFTSLHSIAKQFSDRSHAVDFWTIRFLSESNEWINVRQGENQPMSNNSSTGALISVIQGDGCGYAATSDLTISGLQKAMDRAKNWAEHSQVSGLLNSMQYPRPDAVASYETPVITPWESVSLNDKIDLLMNINRELKIHDSIVDWNAWLGNRNQASLLVSSTGASIEQNIHSIIPGMMVVANAHGVTQVRNADLAGTARQGGLEQLKLIGYEQEAKKVAEQAIALLDAEDCPQERMDLLLSPSQMVLQIHESIGHPLELDRILGDERNYAGTSFVSEEMFGNYQYGSELLNVTFDPTRSEQLASYAYDDEGTKAERTYLIKEGILKQPLGGATSQARTKLKGVANARQADWHRPPIDRMANLNVEPGDTSFADMIANIERGIYMQTNRSWSIDDSRNKFQFGCEFGQLIENGKLTRLVRNPNYRGISATFWRNLAAVGNEDSFEVMGVTNCGKGEPNQSIYVGHATPSCHFRDVEVFGGAS